MFAHIVLDNNNINFSIPLGSFPKNISDLYAVHYCLFDVDQLVLGIHILYILCVYFHPMHSGSFCLVMEK